jgi:DNA gyrase inhibitor GyrI
MKVEIIEREEFMVGGFSVETAGDDSAKDVEILYADFENGKKDLLNNFSKNTKEYYGVLWYTKLHESFRYLVGQKVTERTEEFEIRIIPEGMYAYTKFPQNYDGTKAWTEFYNEGIPGVGYKPVEQNDMAYEYYPDGLDGEYELWSLVEKA